MNPKTRLIVTIVAIALAAATLSVALMRCGTQPAPATEMPTPKAATIAPAGGATEEPGTPTATPGPTPTFTKEEELVATSQHDNSQSVSSPEECSKVLETEPWCNVTKYAKRITRPEWETLFPQAEFYLVRYDLYGRETWQQHNLLVIEQDGQRYAAETFDRLLAANGITEITDENRELVAKAFALMTIGDYLEAEVVFTDWMEVDWMGRRGHLNYGLTAWTKIQGLQITWGFLFQEGHLGEVHRFEVSEFNVDDYVDIPFDVLPLPPYREYHFGGER